MNALEVIPVSRSQQGGSEKDKGRLTEAEA